MTPHGARVREPLRVHLRWLIRRDLDAVLAIEAAGFADPWTEDDFLRCLRQRNCIGLVAEHDDRIVGFCVYELFNDFLRVVDFAVGPAYRRRGVGTQMVAKLVGKLSSHRRATLALDVPERHLAAQLFFRKMDFRATRVLRGAEDAYRMVYRVGPDDDGAEGFMLPVNRIAQYEED